MSPGPFSHSSDLKRLREEGYFVQIRGGLLVLREVPYVTASREIKTGTLISGLDLAGDVTKRPESHQVHFDGEFPCDVNGVLLTGIGNGGQHYDLGHGLMAKFHFSTKPEGGYPDYYEKMTHYANLLAGPAANLKPGTTARGYQSPDEEDDCVFNYTETASDRVGIGALTQLLAGEKIAIIGGGERARTSSTLLPRRQCGRFACSTRTNSFSTTPSALPVHPRSRSFARRQRRCST